MNMQLVTVLLFGLVAVASAGSYEHAFDGDVEIPIFVGTPPQGPFSFTLNPQLSYEYGPTWPVMSRVEDGGVYNAKASSTFKLGSMGRDNVGFTGTDVFKIGGLQLPRGNITVVAKHSTLPKPKVGMAVKYWNITEDTFMEVLLKSLGGHRAIVLGIQKSVSKSASDYHHTGSVVLGEKNPKICASDWTSFNTTIVYNIQMAFPYDSVEIGSYKGENHGIMAFDEIVFQLSKEIYDTAVKVLEVDPTTKQLRCDQKTPIIIRADQMEWRVGPETYIYENEVGECLFRASMNPQVRMIKLPISLLSGSCIRFDFERWAVSFAKLLH